MKRNRLVLITFLLLIILGLIIWSITVYIPPIKGRVVDAETGKPMKGVNVRVGWVTGYADPGGGSFKTFKVYATKTNENGEFILPRIIKFRIPVIEHYQGVNMLIYEHGHAALYKDTVGGIYTLEGADKENTEMNRYATNYFRFKLRAITKEDEYENNFARLWNANVGTDYNFVINETKVFLKKYPNNIRYDSHLRDIAAAYEELGDYQSAKNIYKEIIDRGMSTYDIAEAKKSLRLLEQKITKERESK